MKPDICTRPPTECRIVVTRRESTLLAYLPVYDGNGVIVRGGDPNTHTTHLLCLECGNHGTKSATGGKITEKWAKKGEV